MFIWFVCSNEYQELSNRLSVEDGLGDVEEKKGLDHPSYTSEERVNNVTVIKMDIRDPDITKTGKLCLSPLMKFSRVLNVVIVLEIIIKLWTFL